MLGYIKENTKELCGSMPLHYPADRVTYVNTESGLSATDVQDAIDELAQGAGSSGHTIESSDGTDMTSQPNLQFADAHVTNDSTNSRTKVEVVKSVSESDFDDLDETDAENEGLYGVDSNNNILLTDDMIAHDATHTVREVINELEDINSTFGVTAKFIEKTITIPSNTTLEIDLSNYIPSGKTIKAIGSVCLASSSLYILPYVESGVVKTNLHYLNNNKITIINDTSAWNNYALRLIVYYS